MGVEFTIARRPAQLPDMQRGLGLSSWVFCGVASLLPFLSKDYDQDWLAALVGRIDGQSDFSR